jgi:hypothetical protein
MRTVNCTKVDEFEQFVNLRVRLTQSRVIRNNVEHWRCLQTGDQTRTFVSHP